MKWGKRRFGKGNQEPVSPEHNAWQPWKSPPDRIPTSVRDLRRGRWTRRLLARFLGLAGAFARAIDHLRFQTSPLRTAQTAACVRSFTASFRRTFCTCSLTVSTLIPNERPISLLLKPRAKCRRTCVSRRVSWT